MSSAPRLLDRREWLRLIGLIGLFLGIYLLPIGDPSVQAAVGEGLRLTQWYAREHVILCLLPAFLIAGAIAAFVDKAAVIRYFGPGANRATAYGVGATSGCILAVCSCTVLPLFAGIYRLGAGIGPAIAFLYAGPAINVLAVILTARVLGLEIGLARGIGAVLFSIIIGLSMAMIFERRTLRYGDEDDAESGRPAMVLPDAGSARPLHQLVLMFGLLVAVLVFANWSGVRGEVAGVWQLIHDLRWAITGVCAVALAGVLWRWFAFPFFGLLIVAAAVAIAAYLIPEEPSVPFAVGLVGVCILMTRAGEQGREWWSQTWSYAKLITPLLIGGVFVAGLLLGTPESRGLVPPEWIAEAVGGNGVAANLGASVVGAFMYFATLTEVPIMEGLIGSGMGKGPALALLLAGPALSLPSMLVINSILGFRRTATYVVIVIVGSTAAGLVFGALF